jgi:hypothetical protein
MPACRAGNEAACADALTKKPAAANIHVNRVKPSSLMKRFFLTLVVIVSEAKQSIILLKNLSRVVILPISPLPGIRV